MRKINNFLFLSYKRKKLFINSLVFTLLIRLGLWVLPYRLLTRCLSSLGKSKAMNRQTDWKLIKEISRSVKHCSKYIPSATCLTQALATQTILRLRGQESSLRLGVDKDQTDKLIAHAWLEVDDKIIIGGLTDIKRYSVLTANKELLV